MSFVGSESQFEAEEEEDEEEVVPQTCDLCGQDPCDWETSGEDIWEECNGLKEQGSDNKAVRFHTSYILV
jgi:hypothetical protein